MERDLVSNIFSSPINKKRGLCTVGWYGKVFADYISALVHARVFFCVSHKVKSGSQSDLPG